jgi:hypothetical protein
MASKYLAALTSDEYKDLTLKLLTIQNNICFVCQETIDLKLHETNIDHIVPLANKGFFPHHKKRSRREALLREDAESHQRALPHLLHRFDDDPVDSTQGLEAPGRERFERRRLEGRRHGGADQEGPERFHGRRPSRRFYRLTEPNEDMKLIPDSLGIDADLRLPTASELRKLKYSFDKATFVCMILYHSANREILETPMFQRGFFACLVLKSGPYHGGDDNEDVDTKLHDPRR